MNQKYFMRTSFYVDGKLPLSEDRHIPEEIPDDLLWKGIRSTCNNKDLSFWEFLCRCIDNDTIADFVSNTPLETLLEYVSYDRNDCFMFHQGEQTRIHIRLSFDEEAYYEDHVAPFIIGEPFPDTDER